MNSKSTGTRHGFAVAGAVCVLAAGVGIGRMTAQTSPQNKTPFSSEVRLLPPESSTTDANVEESRRMARCQAGVLTVAHAALVSTVDRHLSISQRRAVASFNGTVPFANDGSVRLSGVSITFLCNSTSTPCYSLVSSAFARNFQNLVLSLNQGVFGDCAGVTRVNFQNQNEMPPSY